MFSSKQLEHERETDILPSSERQSFKVCRVLFEIYQCVSEKCIPALRPPSPHSLLASLFPPFLIFCSISSSFLFCPFRFVYHPLTFASCRIVSIPFVSLLILYRQIQTEVIEVF